MLGQVNYASHITIHFITINNHYYVPGGLASVVTSSGSVWEDYDIIIIYQYI